MREDGTYEFLDENGKAVFSFSSLYMFDADGNDSQDIKLAIVETAKGEYTVTIIPDSEWLKNAVFPVTIDPTISSATTAMSFQDTYINQALPTTQTYYDLPYFFVANGSGIANQRRGLLSFVLPSLTGKKMTYAHLTLTKYDIYTTQRVIELHQNTSIFSENTVTWESQPSCEDEVEDYTIVHSLYGVQYVFDITATCREWAEGISTNYGFTIMDKEETGRYTQFYSSESTGNFPVVEIGYIDPAGLKDYWTYSSQNCGAAGTGYVSDYTGLLSWSRTDFSFATEKQTLGLSFFFDITQKTSNIG
jgi:hypothetical protein